VLIYVVVHGIQRSCSIIVVDYDYERMNVLLHRSEYGDVVHWQSPEDVVQRRTRRRRKKDGDDDGGGGGGDGKMMHPLLDDHRPCWFLG
jgi:hypothetical protein